MIQLNTNDLFKKISFLHRFEPHRSSEEPHHQTQLSSIPRINLFFFFRRRGFVSLQVIHSTYFTSRREERNILKTNAFRDEESKKNTMKRRKKEWKKKKKTKKDWRWEKQIQKEERINWDWGRKKKESIFWLDQKKW